MERNQILPRFASMLKFVLEKASIKTQRQRFGEKALPFPPKVFVEIIKFLRLCLENEVSAEPSEEFDPGPPEKDAPAATKFLVSIEPINLTERYIEMLERFVGAEPGPVQCNALLQAVGCTFKTSAKSFAKKLRWIKTLLDDTREEVREPTAKLFALAAAEMDAEDFEHASQQLSEKFKEKNLELQHGIALALAHAYGRRVLLQRLSTNDNKDLTEWISFRTLVTDLLTPLLAMQSQPLLLSAVCLAIAELGRCGPLPLPDGGEDFEDIHSKFSLVQKLLKLLKNPKTPTRVRERSALALGQMCVGDERFPHQRLVISEFLESASEIKDVELQFTLGEALFYAAAGPQCNLGRDFWQTTESNVHCESGKETAIDWTLTQLCEKHARSTNPNVKVAAALWLLALVKYGQSMHEISKHLLNIQSAFMQLLGDSNDLVQDAASKGIGLVYEISDEVTKEKMITSLLGTLSDGRREVQKVRSWACFLRVLTPT